MAELGAYYITIMPSMKGFTSKVNKELGHLGSAGGKSFSTSFVDVVKGSAIGTALGNLASKAGSAISDGLKTGIERLDIIKNFPKVMEGLGYSTDEADKSIKMIMDHLDGLPTSTQDMVTLTQAISDSTGDLDLATKAALGFNDMMLANGASSAEMANAQGVLNRVLGKGSATVQQWQSLCSVMPAQLGQVARHMLGAEASTEDLHAALENGTVSWNDFLKAIVELDEKGEGAMASFYEQAKNNSVGIGTALENIPNRIGAGWAKILEAIGQQEISSVINNMSYGIRDALGGVAGAIEQLKGKLSELGAFEKFQTVIGMMRDKFGQFGETVKGAVDQAILVIADLIDKGLQWIIDHGESIGRFVDTIAGAFGKVAEVVGGALSGVMPILGNLIDKALTWILDHGEIVAGILAALAAKMVFKGVVDGAKGIIDITNSLKVMSEVLPMVERVGDLPAMFGLVSEAGGPLAGIFGKLGQSGEGLGTAIGAIKNVIPSVTSAFGAMGGSAGGLGGALSALATGPVGIIAAAIVALTAAFKTLYDTNENFRNTVNEVWGGIASKVKEAMDRIGEALKPIAEAMGIQVGDMKSGFEVIVAVVKTFWETISNALGPSFVSLVTSAAAVIKGIVDVVVGVFEVIGGVIRGFKDGDWSMFVGGLKSIWDGFMGMISAPLQGAFAAIKYTLEEMGYKWEEVVGYWRGLWDGLKEGAKTVFGTINGDIKRNLSDAQTVGSSYVKMLSSAANGDWQGMMSNAQTIFSTIDKNITDHLTAARNSGIPVVSDLASNALEKWNWLKTDGAKAFGDLGTSIVDNLTDAKNRALDKANEIKDFWQGLPEQIIGFFRGLGDKISNAFGSIYFPSPHVTWDHIIIGNWTVPLPNVQWYAKGGVFDAATLIGIGEAGKEAALPLNRQTYGEIARGISGEMSSSDVADEIRALREDVQALKLVVQLDSGAIAGGVYPYIDSRMETERRRGARGR